MLGEKKRDVSGTQRFVSILGILSTQRGREVEQICIVERRCITRLLGGIVCLRSLSKIKVFTAGFTMLGNIRSADIMNYEYNNYHQGTTS